MVHVYIVIQNCFALPHLTTYDKDRDPALPPRDSRVSAATQRCKCFENNV